MPTPRAVPVEVRGAVVHVLGTVHGLVAETAAVEAAFAEAAPDALAVGIAPGELEALEAHAAGGDVEESDEEVTIDPSEGYEVGLSRYGEVAIPPPDLLAALDLARGHGVPATAVDLDTTQYDEVFSASVGPFTLFRYGRRMQRMARRPPPAPDAAAFALAWDARVRQLRGFDKVERAREAHMAARVADLAGRHRRILVVVDVARAAGVVEALRQGTFAP